MKASFVTGARHLVQAIHDVVRHPPRDAHVPAAHHPVLSLAETQRAAPGDFQGAPQRPGGGIACLAELRDRATSLRQAYGHKESPRHLPSHKELHDIGTALGHIAGDRRLFPGDAAPLLAAVEQRAATVAEFLRRPSIGHGVAGTQRRAVRQLADAMDTLAQFLRLRMLHVLRVELECEQHPTSGQLRELRDVVATLAHSAQARALLESLQKEQITGLNVAVMKTNPHVAQARSKQFLSYVDSARGLAS